jgi:hypothetical protein
MKNVLAVALTLFTAFSASAQSVSTSELINKAQFVAGEIRQEAQYLSSEQKLRISKNLDSIRRIIDGQDQDMGQDRLAYTCVSRDNDNAAPYVMAIRQGLNIERIRQAQFSQMNGCQEALRSIINIRGTGVLCLSRDNDGASPYVLATLNGAQVSRIERTKTSSMESCTEILNMTRTARGGVMQLCVARDNDGAAPYVAANLEILSGKMEVGTEKFQDIRSCKSFLGIN